MKTKLAIVTGASSGIGQSIAQKLYSLDYHLILFGRHLDRLKKVSSSLAGSEYYQCDFNDLNQITKVCLNLNQKNQEQSYKNAVLINNAGIVKRLAFEDNSQKEWLSQFQTNVFSPAVFTQALLPFLKKQNQARIINISSTLGLRSIPNTSIYSASKAAVNSITQSLALELAEFQIPVNAICPGIIETPIHSFYQTKDEGLRQELNNSQPMKRIGQPEDIAQTVAHLADQASPWITGTLIPIDGGILLNS